MVVNGPHGGVSFNFFMKRQYDTLVEAQKEHISRLGTKHVISDVTVNKTQTILNQYLGKAVLDEQVTNITKHVIKQIAPNEREESAITKFVTRFCKNVYFGSGKVSE